MQTSLFLSNGHALLRHQLKQFQRGRVGKLAIGGKHVMDLADGAGAACPEDAKDVELGVGRP
jgi:hypothetical protein